MRFELCKALNSAKETDIESFYDQASSFIDGMDVADADFLLWLVNINYISERPAFFERLIEKCKELKDGLSFRSKMRLNTIIDIFCKKVGIKAIDHEK